MARARTQRDSYFDDYGRPREDYGQYSPFTDQPEGGGRSTEAEAISQALRPADSYAQNVSERQVPTDRERLTVPGYQTSVEDPETAPAIGTGITPASTSARIANTGTDMTYGSGAPRGYSLLDQYDDNLTRRGGYGGMEPKRKAISSALLSSGEPYSMISGAFGMLDSYMRRRAESAPSDFMIDDVRNVISSAHNDLLGREITPEYLDEILRGGGWEEGDRYGGEEGLAYILDQFATHAEQEKAGRIARGEEADPNAPAPAPAPEAAATAAALASNSGLAPGAYAGSLEGFNTNRFADPSVADNDTWKYRAGRELSQFAPNAEGLAQAVAAMKGRGWDVSQGGSKGDLLQFGNVGSDASGYDISGQAIDVGRGFGAEGSGWAWQPQGGTQEGWYDSNGGDDFAGASDAQSAYARVAQSLDPNADRESMEAALTSAFSGVPGFERAYKESVLINGQWYDLVAGYGAPGATWQGLVPKMDSGGAGGFLPTGSTNPLSQALAGAGLQGGGTDSYTRKLLDEIMQSLALGRAMGNV